MTPVSKAIGLYSQKRADGREVGMEGEMDRGGGMRLGGDLPSHRN